MRRRADIVPVEWWERPHGEGEQSPEEARSEPCRYMGKGIKSRGNSWCKRSEAGIWPMCFNSKETNVE